MLPGYLRRALLMTGILNVVGGFLFLPILPIARRWVGLPEAPPFYLWLLAIWIAGFGVVYFKLGWSGAPDRSFLSIGALGKLSFACLLIAFWLSGEFPFGAPLAGAADLCFGSLFAFYLWQTRTN